MIQRKFNNEKPKCKKTSKKKKVYIFFSDQGFHY